MKTKQTEKGDANVQKKTCTTQRRSFILFNLHIVLNKQTRKRKLKIKIKKKQKLSSIFGRT